MKSKWTDLNVSDGHEAHARNSRENVQHLRMEIINKRRRKRLITEHETNLLKVVRQQQLDRRDVRTATVIEKTTNIAMRRGVDRELRVRNVFL